MSTPRSTPPSAPRSAACDHPSARPGRDRQPAARPGRVRGDLGPLLTLPDDGRGGPLQQRLFDRLRAAILDGILAPGDRLPSTRTLARDLGLSRNTALAAIERLTAEGYLEARVGSGTYVTGKLPEEYGARPLAAPPSPPPSPSTSTVPGGGAPTLPFRPGVAALDQFDVDTWRRLLARSWRSLPVRALDRDRGGGWRPLRQAVAAYLDAGRGIRCHPDQIIILPSRAAALELAATLAGEPGDTAWMEDPGCPTTAALLRRLGLRAVPVPVDGEGLDVAAGRDLAPQSRLAVVAPGCQMPVGSLMSLERRHALLAWARSGGALIVEDDSDGGYRFSGQAPTALYSLDAAAPGGGGRVLHLGSFDRLLYPGLRVAYLVLPPALVERAVALRALLDLHVPVAEQSTLAEFIDDGHLASHLRRSRVTYQERREALFDAARRLWSGALTLVPAPAGLQTVARFGPAAPDGGHMARDAGRDAAFCRAAAGRSLDLVPLSGFFHTAGHAAGQAADRGQGLVLGFGAFAPPLIARAAERLAQILEQPAHRSAA